MGYKILMVTNALDIGGAETHVVELSLALQQQGHEVILASNGGAYVPRIEAEGLRHAKMPLNKRSFGALQKSLRALDKLIARERPNIVHAHARIPAFLCGLLQKKYPFAFVTTAHWVFHTNWLLSRVSNWGQQTLAVSPDIQDYLIKNYHLPLEQITITVNGINARVFSPEAEGAAPAEAPAPDPARPVLGLVSRLDEDRSQLAKLLLEIAPALHQALPKLQLLLVGDGEDFPALQETAARFNADAEKPYIHMPGGRTDIPELLALCDGFVGVSRAALEAMSCALPVILAGNEGYQGILRPENIAAAQQSNLCCRGCPAPTAEALLEDVLTLFSMEEAERRSLGDFGREIVLGQYSVARMANDCMQVYQKALSHS